MDEQIRDHACIRTSYVPHSLCSRCFTYMRDVPCKPVKVLNLWTLWDIRQRSRLGARHVRRCVCVVCGHTQQAGKQSFFHVSLRREGTTHNTQHMTFSATEVLRVRTPCARKDAVSCVVPAADSGV